MRINAAHLEYRVYMSLPQSPEYGAWFNSFVFRTSVAPDASRSALMCNQLMTSMRAFHLATVKMERVAVFNYNLAATTSGDEAPFVYHADRQIEAAPRPVTNPCPPYVALQLNRETVGGMPGRIWLFHSLNEDEVIRGHAGALVLKDANFWEAHVSFWWRDALNAFNDFQLVVPDRPGYGTSTVPARNATVTLGHPVQARARERSRAGVVPKRREVQEKTGNLAEIAEQLHQELKMWHGTDLGLTPGSYKDRVLGMITGVRAWALELKKWADAEGSTAETPLYKPLSRWGRDAASLSGYCSIIDGQYEKDLDQASKVMPYFDSGGDQRLGKVETETMMDYARTWGNLAAGLFDFDFTTPYNVVEEQEPQPSA